MSTTSVAVANVQTADRWRLGMRIYRARGSARGAVLCGHAMMTDGRYFDKPVGEGFATWLARQGFDVFVPDFRGHGLSGPGAEAGARWSFDELVKYDWPALRAAAADASCCSAADLCVIGHSLGGLVVAADAVRSGFQARRTVFLSANVWNLRAMSLVEAMKARGLLSMLSVMPRLGRPVPVRRLGIGTADEAPQYIRQFVDWCQSGRFESLDGMDYRAALPVWRRAAVAVVGQGDWMCTEQGAGRFLGSSPSIPLAVEGPSSGLSFAPDHFSLLTRQPGNEWHRRLADFLDSGLYEGARTLL